MYSHLLKGFTVGQTLTRRVFRNITSLVGLLIDAIFVANLYPGGYSQYWQQASISYFDETRVAGYCRGLSGWAGDIIGYVIGSIAGVIIGFACYIPDIILRGICELNDLIGNTLNSFANIVGSHPLCQHFNNANPPNNYIQKAWNISIGTLGLIVALPLYSVTKLVETFLPFLGHSLSNTAWALGGHAGGMIGILISIPIFPIKHVCNTLVDLYRGFRNKVRSLTAFIYAKTNQTCAAEINDECIPAIPNAVMHAPEFRQKVEEYKRSSTTEILCGSLRLAHAAPEPYANPPRNAAPAQLPPPEVAPPPYCNNALSHSVVRPSAPPR